MNLLMYISLRLLSGIKTGFLLLNANGAAVIDEEDGYGRSYQAETGKDDRINGLPSVYMFDDPATQQTIDDLWQRDKEIEDPHIDAHLPRRQTAAENNIGHS